MTKSDLGCTDLSVGAVKALRAANIETAANLLSLLGKSRGEITALIPTAGRFARSYATEIAEELKGTHVFDLALPALSLNEVRECLLRIVRECDSDAAHVATGLALEEMFRRGSCSKRLAA